MVSERVLETQKHSVSCIETKGTKWRKIGKRGRDPETTKSRKDTELNKRETGNQNE